MKAVIFDGSAVDDLAGRRIRRLLTGHLSAKGAVTEVWTIRDLKINPCAGDFFCWIRTPGQCIFDDDNRRLAAAVVNSDLLIYLTPVTFGGYSSGLKRAVDHLIQNVLPFFIKLEGETHHQKRYTAYPDFLAIGWLDQPEPDAEACFRNLVRRNAINMHARRFCGGIVLAGQPDEAIATAIGDWLNWPSPATEPAGSAPIGHPAAESLFRPVRQVVLLVGSPKLRQSTSHALGRYLLDQFDPAAVSANTFFLPAINHSPEKMAAMFQAVQSADLVVLAFPLYVDTLPAPMIAALEQLAARRREQGQGAGRGQDTLLAALVNCGFPESGHNANALTVCSLFARQAGFRWAGGMMFGGANGLGEKPLAEWGGRTAEIRMALNQAAAALAQGQAIPVEAQARAAKSAIPPSLYLRIANLGWKFLARPYGAAKNLRCHPYRN